MNFLKELEPFKAELDAFQKLKTAPSHPKAGLIIDIWDAFKNEPETSKVIHQGKVKLLPKTDKGCGYCVNHAFNDILKWRNHLTSNPPVHFRGDADKLVMNKPVATISEKVITDKPMTI